MYMTQPTRYFKHSSAGTDWAGSVVLWQLRSWWDEESAQWFGQPGLAGYQLFAVSRGEESAWEI
jgi:hypothetical protein